MVVRGKKNLHGLMESNLLVAKIVNARSHLTAVRIRLTRFVFWLGDLKHVLPELAHKPDKRPILMCFSKPAGIWHCSFYQDEYRKQRLPRSFTHRDSARLWTVRSAVTQISATLEPALSSSRTSTMVMVQSGRKSQMSKLQLSHSGRCNHIVFVSSEFGGEHTISNIHGPCLKGRNPH